ncbi:hypothetical protein N5P37_009945 [Trichoderma harzianum]|nr:hypothetical protein N5P37_009945 [Trichoderma harzianum]
MEATDPFTDRVKSSTDPELSSPFSDKRGLFDGEYPGHEPFLARPRPDIYTKQLPPISGVSDGGDSAEGGNSENFVLSPNPFLRAFGPGDVTLPCEAEPPERRLCFQRFVDNESRDRHYLSSHREFAKEQGIQYLARACTICDAKFHRRDNLKRHIEDHHSIHKEHGAAGLELTDLDNEDFANVGTDTVNDVAAGGRSSRDERDRGFFNTKLGAQVAQESDVQDRNISPNDEYMQAQAQARAHGRGQSLANYNDDFTIKVSGRAVVKIPGTQIEYDGGEITISTNSEAGARPGSGMPGASRAVNDKESTAYQAQAQVQAQAQHQAQEPQQAHSNATLRVQMQAHASLVYNRLMEVAADQFSGPENVPQETVDKIKQESYAQTQRLAKDLVQQRAQQQQQREQKAAMQAMDGIEVARSEKEGSIQGNKGATQLKDVSSPPLESLAPVIGSTLDRPHNDISSLKIEQEKAEDDLDPFAEYFDELEDEILEDENKMQERERRWVDIIKLWENNEPPFHLKS